MTPRIRSIARHAIITGLLTPAEVARAAGMSLQAVHKWTDPEKAKQSRIMFSATLFEELINPNAKAASMSKGQLRRLHDQIACNLSDQV